MNIPAMAKALRALADAIETPAATAPALAPVPATLLAAAAPAVPVVAAVAATAIVRPRGRPPGAAKPAAAVAPPATPAPTAAAPAAPATASLSAAATLGASGLTHAAVANDFKAAALAHGRDFVKGLLTAHGAATFDKVKDLAAFQAQLKAGPQAAAPAVDAADLLG